MDEKKLRTWAKEKAAHIILAQPEQLTPLKQLKKIESLIDAVIDNCATTQPTVEISDMQKRMQAFTAELERLNKIVEEPPE